MEILMRAKLRAQAERTTLKEAIDRELAEYDTWLPMSTPDGTFRKRPPRPKGTAQRLRARPSGRNEARDLWATVRIALKRVVEHELRDLTDSLTKDRLRGQVEVELEGALGMLRSRVKRAHLDEAPTVDVADAAKQRASLRNACTTLGVDAPKRGERVDHATYMTAKKNYKKLVRSYHPDQGGDVALYQSVVEAMRAIEENYQVEDATTATDTETGDDQS